MRLTVPFGKQGWRPLTRLTSTPGAMVHIAPMARSAPENGTEGEEDQAEQKEGHKAAQESETAKSVKRVSINHGEVWHNSLPSFTCRWLSADRNALRHTGFIGISPQAKYSCHQNQRHNKSEEDTPVHFRSFMRILISCEI